MGIEDNFLHIHLGPSNPHAVLESGWLTILILQGFGHGVTQMRFSGRARHLGGRAWLQESRDPF
jgi:hypothetical protein